ncbi:MAG: nuclear transport factor 2 (NTF2) superfamily protein [Sulfurimonas sp.]|jgi:nuclear transport factor 2 (NTF2) superfamily protein
MKAEKKLPLPPFDLESATLKVRMAENGWNLKNPENVSMAYSLNSNWRNRNLFINGRDESISFLKNKYSKELSYKLCKELWAYTEDKIAVRFAYEWHDDNGQWYRSYGNENWEFDENGLMKVRFACINDLAINESDRKLLWKEDIRPSDYPSLSDMGL